MCVVSEQKDNQTLIFTNIVHLYRLCFYTYIYSNLGIENAPLYSDCSYHTPISATKIASSSEISNQRNLGKIYPLSPDPN